VTAPTRKVDKVVIIENDGVTVSLTMNFAENLCVRVRCKKERTGVFSHDESGTAHQTMCYEHAMDCFNRNRQCPVCEKPVSAILQVFH